MMDKTKGDPMDKERRQFKRFDTFISVKYQAEAPVWNSGDEFK